MLSADNIKFVDWSADSIKFVDKSKSIRNVNGAA
jgi:hypothetical protein